jgi:hypothetical protein
VLEEQLAASRHETEEAHLWEVLKMVDHERAVVVGVWQGASVALATLQFCTGQDFQWVAPRFSDHARQAEPAKLVGDFAVAAAAVVALVNMEDILCGGGQGP